MDIQIRGRQNVHAEKRCATTSEQGFGALQIRVVFVRSTARGNGKARKRPSLQSSAGLPGPSQEQSLPSSKNFIKTHKMQIGGFQRLKSKESSTHLTTS